MPLSLAQRINRCAEHHMSLKRSAIWIYAMNSTSPVNDQVRLELTLFTESMQATEEAAKLFGLYNSLKTPTGAEKRAIAKLYRAINSYTSTNRNINALVESDKKRASRKASRTKSRG